jgi:putative ABC transport system permease protein
MPLWWRLATRNWWISPGRCIASIVSVALGVAIVVIITSFHETARHAVTQEVLPRFLGNAHLTVHPPGGHWGTLDASIAKRIAALPNVDHVAARLGSRMKLFRPVEADRLLVVHWEWVDAIGIEPEAQRYFHLPQPDDGRPLNPGERGAALIERETADRWGADIGKDIVLQPYEGGPQARLTVVGIFDSERIAEFQSPVVYYSIEDAQELEGKPDVASIIDVMLRDSSSAATDQTKRDIEQVIAEHGGPYTYFVESASGRTALIEEAHAIARFALVLTSIIALLTSFFIILTTMSISLFERRGQFGAMRCIGLSRSQLGALVFVEVVPIGVLGTLSGLALGIGACRLVEVVAAHLVSRVILSTWGLQLAALSGLLTTLLCAAFLVFQVNRVTPLTALYPEAKPDRRIYPILAGIVGVAMLMGHEWMLQQREREAWWSLSAAGVVVATLYCGYILIVPAVVVLLGGPIARIVGPMLRLPGKLAADQFARTPWRGAAVCWVLMVGLSLIVYTGLNVSALMAIWDFPARLPEAFVWSSEYIEPEAVERVRALPGVRRVATTTDVECEVQGVDTVPESLTARFIRSVTEKLTRPVFVAGDPDVIFDIVKVAFIEGSLEDAMPKLKRGGYVLIPVQTSRYKNLHVGDRVNVTVGRESAEFEVAGVVQSPALDMAVTAFQASGYLQIAAATALLGTQADLKEKLGFDGVSMFMCDLNLPQSTPPASFDPMELPIFRDRRSVARAILDWGEALPTQHDQIEAVRPQLQQWLDSSADEHEVGTMPLAQDTNQLLHRFAVAIQRLYWAQGRSRLSTEQAWTLFRERLVLLRIADEIDRPDAIIGSLRRLHMEFDRNLRRASIVVTWLPSILLVVAAIGIGNLMMVSVRIRARQIAVLRAVGAVQSQILRLVLAEAITLGLIGSVIGLALGFHEAWTDHRLTETVSGFYPEWVVPIGSVTIGVLVTVGVCLIAGLAPARRAARGNIIDAMRVA